MRWLLVLILFFLISCRGKIQNSQVRQFNFDSLLAKQATLLTRDAASLEKKTSVNAEENISTAEPKDIKWEEELKAFEVLELVNKPVYSGAYDIGESQDEKSNLMVKSWAAKANVPVRSIKIYYLDNPQLLKRLEARVEQTNFVFSSVKDLTLEFNLFGGNPVPVRYEISGSQSYFWGAPQYYSLEGFIRVK